MASTTNEDELAVEQTEGFKVGEKKTIDEYQQLGKAGTIFAVNLPNIQSGHMEYLEKARNLTHLYHGSWVLDSYHPSKLPSTITGTSSCT